MKLTHVFKLVSFSLLVVILVEGQTIKAIGPDKKMATEASISDSSNRTAVRAARLLDVKNGNVINNSSGFRRSIIAKKQKSVPLNLE